MFQNGLGFGYLKRKLLGTEPYTLEQAAKIYMHKQNIRNRFELRTDGG